MSDEIQYEETSLAKALLELTKIQEALGKDILLCTKMLEQEDNQFWRRTLVRTSFAFIEGTVYRMKQLASEVFSYEEVSLPRFEVAMLLEESYELKENGEARIKANYIKITKNLKFAFKMLARAYGVNYDLVVDDAGWVNFEKGLKIRDRLMHPKSTSALNVADEDVSTVDKAVGWFGTSAHELQSKIELSLNERADALNDEEA